MAKHSAAAFLRKINLFMYNDQFSAITINSIGGQPFRKHAEIFINIPNNLRIAAPWREVDKQLEQRKLNIKDFYFKLALKTEPIIDDTTLRDGIQMPGLTVDSKDVAEIAKLLSEIGVERIEVFHYQEPDRKAINIIQNLDLDIRVDGWCREVK